MLQPNITGPPSQPQTQQIMISPTVSLPNNHPQNIQKYKNILRKLAITEVILGVLCIILEIIILGTITDACDRYYPYYSTSYSYRYCYTITFGEGIWCGIWIVIAGGLGIPCGKSNSSICLIKTHMAFSIVGAVFSGVLFSLAVTLALINFSKIVSIVSYSILCFISFTAMVILILSASYCCVVQGCGCCSQAHTPPYSRQVVFTQQPFANQQMFGNLPGIGLNQPFTSGHQFAIQPVMMQPALMQPNIMQPTPNVNNPYIQNIQTGPKQVLQQNFDAGQTANSLPTYENLLPS